MHSISRTSDVDGWPFHYSTFMGLFLLGFEVDYGGTYDLQTFVSLLQSFFFQNADFFDLSFIGSNFLDHLISEVIKNFSFFFEKFDSFLKSF